jgi:tRNA(fMet)-specific endonuclease VapC
LAYFFRGLLCLPFEDRASEVYAEIRLRLERAGKPIGPNDLLIAATAIANRLVLVTHNTGEFGRIEGLTVEDWEAPAT